MCFDVSVVVLIKDIALKERGNQPALERLTLCVRLIVCEGSVRVSGARWVIAWR